MFSKNLILFLALAILLSVADSFLLSKNAIRPIYQNLLNCNNQLSLKIPLKHNGHKHFMSNSESSEFDFMSFLQKTFNVNTNTNTQSDNVVVNESKEAKAEPIVEKIETAEIVEKPVDPKKERTYIMIKPDGVQRGLVGKIIGRFEDKGYFLKGLKLITPSQDILQEHYKDLASKGFFPKLIKYMSSGPVVAMVWEGKGVVKTGRVMLGATNPLESQPGTIRGDYAVEVGRNVCHGSDSVESANREIALWFKEGLNEYDNHSLDWIYE